MAGCKKSEMYKINVKEVKLRDNEGEDNEGEDLESDVFRLESDEIWICQG